MQVVVGRDRTEIERSEGRRSDNGRASHMAIINAPEEMLDNSMKRRFLGRVGVEYCVRDVVFWRHQRVAATYDSTVYKYKIMGAETRTEATKSPQLM